MSTLTQQASDALDLLERIGNASPFVFTLVVLTLTIITVYLLIKLVFSQNRKLGHSKAIIVSLYVQAGVDPKDAVTRAHKEINAVE